MDSRAALASAKSLFQKQDYAGVVALLNEALKADVSNYKLLDSRGAACFKLGQHREALADAKKQIELQPTAAQGYKRAANVCQAQKMWATAIKVLEAACRRCSEDKQLKGLNDGGALDAYLSSANRIAATVDSIRILPATSRVACSHVCRAWRNIVVQDPQCWRDLTLRGTSAASRRKVAAWKMRLDGRSLRALRLDTEPAIAEVMPLAENMDRLQELTVDFAGMVRPEPLFKLLLHLRSESTETLTCLQLQLPPASCFYPDLFLFLSHFTRLRSCWLTIPGSGQHGRIDLPRLDLEAQKLASLTFPAMCDFRVDFCDTRAPVPLELHFPQLERLTWHGALPFLQSNAIMPRLKSLDVHWLHDEQQSTTRPMESLVNLSLGRQFGPLPLQQLCCPQLQTLRLTGGRQAQLATTLPDFATRSPLVTSLRIDYLSSLSDAQFIGILALWPRLSQLDLQHTNLEGAFVEDLPSLKQPLTHFGLSQCGTIKASPIIKLVKSRLDAGAKLESLTLMDCPAMEPEGLKWLRETVPQVKHRYQDPKEEARMARRILAR